MKKYLESTELLNYNDDTIQELIRTRGFNNLDEYDKIGEIYNFVKEEILFGYNPKDEIPASEILKSGIGQCNTKATLLISLLRAVGVPARFHASYLDNYVQLGIIPTSLSKLVPKEILHTWAEIYYKDQWIALEGVILDDGYIEGFINSGIAGDACEYQGYAFGVNDMKNLEVQWQGKNTAIQSTGIVNDLGIFDSPDECYKLYSQKIGVIKGWIYSNILRHVMNKRTAEIRNLSANSSVNK